MTTIPYAEFLARRQARARTTGRLASNLHPSLKPFQQHIVKWACEVGSPAVWADTGLGKTRMQLEWARVMADRSLIVTPLAVAEQTVAEAAKIGIEARYVRSPDDVAGQGIFITNTELADRFDPSLWGAVALDEASILKQSDGKTRTRLIQTFASVPYRSAWTATPAPNDVEELTNQAEFLGHMTRTNMLAAYFVHDQDGWRLKGHAVGPMCDWMSGWALAVRKPSDLGFDDAGYNLPGLRIVPQIVAADVEPEGDALFALTPGGVSGRARVRRESLEARVERAVALVNAEPDEPWLLWCGMNDEADALAARIPGAVNVHGSMSPDEKARELLAFANGDTRVLITKPSIAGMGLNFQHSARMAFVGLSDSYEAYYQCIRRQYRYGQDRVVEAHVVLSEVEQAIADNVLRKERQANRIVDEMVRRIERAS